MKKMVAVFAHPDDEAFGPGGSIALWTKEYEITLICVTAGQAGMHNDCSAEELGEIRKSELLRSAKVLGVKEVLFLDYIDGELRNSIYHKLAQDIQKIIDTIKPDVLLTFEPRGVSGHIDHVVVSLVATYIFGKVEYIKTLFYYCLNEARQKVMSKNYFIYFPPGYKKEEIGKVMDVSTVWEIKVAAMQEHKSQIHDVERILTRSKDLPKEESFLVVRK